MNLELGILLALACAFVANLGFFYKYRGANAVAKVDVRHPLRSVSSTEVPAFLARLKMLTCPSDRIIRIQIAVWRSE